MVKYSGMQSLRGHLLIASPHLEDRNFFHTVVLVVQHSDAGALGLILNRPLSMTVRAAWTQVSSAPCRNEGLLHHGGPCEGPLMVIHTDQELADLEVLPGLYFCTDRESIQRLVSQDHCRAKFFVGFAGWAPGQLDGEMEDGGWLTTPATIEHVFGEYVDQWAEAIRAAGRASPLGQYKPKIDPEDPSVN